VFVRSDDTRSYGTDGSVKVTSKKKSVLPDVLLNLKEFSDSLTPEKLRELQEKVLAGVKEREAVRKKERDAPPESKTGTCGVCQGRVVGEYEKAPSYEGMYMGRGPLHNVPRRIIWHFKGYHCEKCGLCYKFPTNKVD